MQTFCLFGHKTLMKLRSAFLTVILASVAAIAHGTTMAAPIVFFDIAGPDSARQAAFYRDVFGWENGPGGTLSIPVTGSTLSGALRQDPADKVIYLGVDDVSVALAKVEAHGGRTVHPRFEVKGVAVLGLFTDPAGNSMGLVEMQGGRPKTP